MASVNLIAGWIAIFAGLLSGTILGIFFHRDNWLGGYNSWPRRMLRLGHISMVGLGLLNIAFTLTVINLKLAPPRLAAILFIVGLISMPTVCAFSAFRPNMRHLFFIPVASLLGAVADFICRGILS